MDSLCCKSGLCLSFEHCLPFGHSYKKDTGDGEESFQEGPEA